VGRVVRPCSLLAAEGSSDGSDGAAAANADDNDSDNSDEKLHEKDNRSFSSLEVLRPELLQSLERLGHKTMTTIQKKSLPLALAGKDVIGKAKTGSGKTAAFGLALLQKIDLTMDNRRGRPQAIVLSPTRELAQQLVTSIRTLATSMNGLRVVALTGGMPSRDQRAGLKLGAHVVVATPGRCLQLLEDGCLHMVVVSTLVMDEADTLLDMGFEEEVNRILHFLPSSSHNEKEGNRRCYQTLLFSATWGNRVEQLSKRVQHQPEMVSDGVVSQNQKDIQASASSTAAAQVDRSLLHQSALLFTGNDDNARLAALSHVLATSNNIAATKNGSSSSSCIIFCETRAQCNSVSDFLRVRGVSALPLHGELEQNDREKTLVRFRNKTCRILVATNVASRGLDVDGVGLVICYELNKDVDVHVHRVGRTARAESLGEAVSLVSASSVEGRKGGSEIQRLDAIDEAFGGESIPRNMHKQKKGNEEDDDLKEKGWAADWSTLLVMGGRKDKIRPGDVLGAISSDNVGIEGADVGKIEVMDRRTWVAVRTSVAKKAAEGLGKSKIKKRKFRVHLIDS